jgi:O-antigen/teichoic acid export membrane protein
MERSSLYRGGLVLLVGFIFLKLGGVLFRIICMNVLPVEAYGEVAVFLILFNWFMLFATFNVTLGLAKFVSGDSSEGKLYYTAALLGSLVTGLVISGVLLIMAPALSQAVNVSVSVLYWAIIAIPFAVVYNIGIFYFRGLYRMKASTLTDAAMTVARIAALVGLLYAGIYYAPFLAFVVSFIVIDVYLLIRNRDAFDYGRETLSVFRTLLIYSFPIFLSEFLRQFAMNLDRVVLSGFHSAVEAGFYDVGVALCLGYLIIANSYSNALLPRASENQLDTRKRRLELFRSLKASSALFMLYTLLLLLAGRPVINIINPAYMGVFDFLLPLAGAYIVLGFLTILYFFVNSIGKQRYAVYAGAVFAFLSLALNVYLVPVMLYMGAIYALLISSLVSIIVIGALVWKSERH